MSSSADFIRSINVYVGIPVFVGGMLGNLLNMRFLWRTRHNSCAFIFLASSLINCVVLFYGLFTRIVSTGFDLDRSATNLIWCKTRMAFSTASFLMSLTCVCLASIDRFLASCRQEKYRSWSRLSTARWAVLATIVIWTGHAVPELVYGQLVRNPSTGITTCSSVTPEAFSTYRTYVSLPFYVGVIPAIVLAITDLLTYRNTKTLQMGTQREMIQRQLTSMMLIQIPIIIFSTVPYVTFNEYLIFSATTVKTASQRAVESVISNVLTLIFYTSFATSFSVFFFSSKSFRDEAKRFFLCQKVNSPNTRTTQVQPFSTAVARTMNL